MIGWRNLVIVTIIGALSVVVADRIGLVKFLSEATGG